MEQATIEIGKLFQVCSMFVPSLGSKINLSPAQVREAFQIVFMSVEHLVFLPIDLKSLMLLFVSKRC